MAAWGRVSAGASEMLLLSGYAGIGKSTLIQELQKPVVGQRGYFVTRKFDQLTQNLPYHAVRQAFRDLIRQLLAEDERGVAVWRAKLYDVLGAVGQVIIDFIPEVELLIGKQPPLPELGFSEAQNRFTFFFQRFVHVFAQKEHPLVIFLDDLQWVDLASLQLIQLLITDPNPQTLLMICAYRDNDVSETHPLRLALAALQQKGVTINTIALTPLALTDLTRLIADMLASDRAHAAPLAELVFQKTNGNPFFVIQFLQALYQELSDLDATVRLPFPANRHGHSERWREYGADSAWNMTDNMVELMVSKLQKLATEPQLILGICCLYWQLFCAANPVPCL